MTGATPEDPLAKALLDKQIEAIGWALLNAEAGDQIVSHEAGCLSILLGADCNCRPRIFVVPNTKGYSA